MLTVVAEIGGNTHAESTFGIGMGVTSKLIMVTYICQVNRVKISSALEQVLVAKFQFRFRDKDGFCTINHVLVQTLLFGADIDLD